MNQLFFVLALMLVAHSMAFRALKPAIARSKAPLKMMESLPEALQTTQSFLVASETTPQDSLFAFLFIATCIMGKINNASDLFFRFPYFTIIILTLTL